MKKLALAITAVLITATAPVQAAGILTSNSLGAICKGLSTATYSKASCESILLNSGKVSVLGKDFTTDTIVETVKTKVLKAVGDDPQSAFSLVTDQDVNNICTGSSGDWHHGKQSCIVDVLYSDKVIVVSESLLTPAVQQQIDTALLKFSKDQ